MQTGYSSQAEPPERAWPQTIAGLPAAILVSLECQLHYLVAPCTISRILSLMPADQVQDILFSQKGWQALGKYFRFLHFTSEQPEGLHRHVLRFGFNLPRLGHMEEFNPLLTMVMLFIDAVGQHKLSPEQRKKGEERRQELEKQTTKVGSGQESRLEELRMKKAEEEKVSRGCGCMSCTWCCRTCSGSNILHQRECGSKANRDKVSLGTGSTCCICCQRARYREQLKQQFVFNSKPRAKRL